MKFSFPTIAIGGHKQVVNHEPALELAAQAELTPVIALNDVEFNDEIEVFLIAEANADSSGVVQILQQLQIPYTAVSINDTPLPADHPELLFQRDPTVLAHAERQYRKFVAHQAVLRNADPEKTTLVMTPHFTRLPDITNTEILLHINAAPRFLQTTHRPYEVVSLCSCFQSQPYNPIMRYCREYAELTTIKQIDPLAVETLRPMLTGFDGRYREYNMKWHLGCAAYVIGEVGRRKWKAAGHGHGMPVDLFLVNELNALVLQNTIFEAIPADLDMLTQISDV